MREVRWASAEGDGIEHLTFDARDDGFYVESVVVGQRYSKPYGLFYQVRCDLQWRTLRAYLKIAGGGELELLGDGAGNWHDGHGQWLGGIEGCIDIDIAATPFTNTLPIRRLQLAQGERQPISVAYISTPDLQVTRAGQAYSCVELNREYRYEGIFRDFTANLTVDEDGIVIDYPTLFRRLAPLPLPPR
ncbi:putative glycolipid-binding domain-containing protein [Paraburkholderia sp. A1RI_3L]|uniref:putative glycolipid-binding domain-containing protein n=1 Tax=Paraburkholderia TaxID=1822464 RepID=UPI002407E523|nr:putative glycolipid-binding domain-containing protein [Paraburkholderia sp. SUR17]WEY42841.1 putative glycolipid-binding domain-containing protein [Paraburkholderia sp. SUR17]